MAKSLEIRHDETPSTNRLFNVFLLIAVGILTVMAFTTYASEQAPEESAPVATP